MYIWVLLYLLQYTCSLDANVITIMATVTHSQSHLPTDFSFKNLHTLITIYCLITVINAYTRLNKGQPATVTRKTTTITAAAAAAEQQTKMEAIKLTVLHTTVLYSYNENWN